MKSFIVYNMSERILRTGCCSDGDFLLQAGDGEFVKEGTANDITQKIENPGIDGKVVDKTQEEIEADNPTPPEITFEKRPAHINNEQWQDILDRLDKLDNRSTKIGE